MSEILQWVIVGAVIVAAVVFLVRRMRKRATCEGCPQAEQCLGSDREVGDGQRPEP